jgi:hypothetical protein
MDPMCISGGGQNVGIVLRSLLAQAKERKHGKRTLLPRSLPKLDALAVDVRALKSRTNEKPADEIGGLDLAVKITGLARTYHLQADPPSGRSLTAALVVGSTSSEAELLAMDRERTPPDGFRDRRGTNGWKQVSGQRANANPLKN